MAGAGIGARARADFGFLARAGAESRVGAELKLEGSKSKSCILSNN